MAAAQMDPNDKKNQYLGHGSGPSHCHRPKILEIGRPEIGCYIGNKADKICSHKKEWHIIDWSVLLGNLTKLMGSSMGKILQAQKIQQQPNTNPTSQAGHREFYSDWALTALMGYAQVYTEVGIPEILGNFSSVQGMCWQPPGIISRYDVLGQDKWHRNWCSCILRQAGNWINGKNKIQPGRPGGNVWKYKKWDFIIYGDPKNDTINWRRYQEVRGGSWITRYKNPIRVTPYGKADPRRPQRNWYELKEILATFTAFLWVLFGDVCPLYDKNYKLWRVLNHPSIKAVNSRFTRVRCSHITWQVLDEIRLFFINVWDQIILQIGDQEDSPQLI